MKGFLLFWQVVCLMICLSVIVAALSVDFVSPPTPEDGTATTNKSFEVVVSISDVAGAVKEALWSWSGDRFFILNDSLILLLNFDNVQEIGENESYFIDISKNGFDGICQATNCPIAVAGRHFGAYRFSSDYITVGNEINPEDKDFSVFSWIRFIDAGGAQTVMSNKMGEGHGGWSLRGAGEEGAGLNVMLQSENRLKYYYSSYDLDDSAWHFIGFSWNNRADLLKLYVDGKEVSASKEADDYLSGESIISIYNATIGASPNATRREYFNGEIDETSVYLRALSKEDVEAIYSSNIRKYESDKWEFYINPSGDISDFTESTYSYELIVRDSSISESSGTRNITLLPENPRILNVSIEDFSESVLLNPASLKNISCIARIRDFNGEESAYFAEAVFYHEAVSAEEADDKNYHYTDGGCTIERDFGEWHGYQDDENQFLANCSFEVAYFAEPGMWHCQIKVEDESGLNDTAEGNIGIEELLAMEIPEEIAYGNVSPLSVSDEKVFAIGNVGNVALNLQISGFAQEQGDGYAMRCGGDSFIDRSYERYNLSESNPGEISLWEFEERYSPIQSTEILEQVYLSQRMDDFISEAEILSYWRVYVPEGAKGSCSGKIMVGAVAA